MNQELSTINLLCVGDVILDLFLNIEHDTEFAHFDKTSNMISFLSGSKILADKIKYVPGGNANNVSVGTKRLGIESTIIVETGSDEFAEILIKYLKKENVNISHLLQNPNSTATFSLNLFYGAERIIFIHHVKREHNIDLATVVPQNIFLTSMGQTWQPIYEKILDLKIKNNAKLFFNPGSQQLDDGVKTFQNVLNRTDIIFVNKEEAEKITLGKVINSNINDLLKNVQKSGPKNVCITDGKNGSYFLDEKGNFYSQVALEGEIVNKTGAGDAFTSGFLSAYLKGKDIKTAMHWGALNSKSVMSHVGAQTGLLKLAEIETQN